MMPFCVGDSVRAFFDLEDEASSDAFRLVAKRVSGRVTVQEEVD
jgi:hypothetical protein